MIIVITDSKIDKVYSSLHPGGQHRFTTFPTTLLDGNINGMTN